MQHPPPQPALRPFSLADAPRIEASINEAAFPPDAIANACVQARPRPRAAAPPSPVRATSNIWTLMRKGVAAGALTVAVHAVEP
eukprot:4386971-Pleurochrysis_carterae.AAC.2